VKEAVLVLCALACLSVTGCAGQLSTDEAERLRGEHERLRGSTGGSTGSGGEGGTDPAACVAALASGPKCVACHGEMVHSAGFAFSPASIMNARQLWLDKPGQGDPPGMMLACGAPDKAGYKLIDSKAPEMSLIYAKLTDPVPCGMHMPLVGYPLPEVDKACVLTWIKSIAGGTP
jgi:hypothetical protein